MASFSKSFYQENSNSLFLGLRGYRQRPYFPGRWSVKMQRSTSEQLRTGIYNGEISDVFRDFKLSSGQHDAFGSVCVNQAQKRVEYRA